MSRYQVQSNILDIRCSNLAPNYSALATWMGEHWGKTLGTHGGRWGRRWQGKKNYFGNRPWVFYLFFFQARDISAHVEVGQKRKLGKHPRGSRLLCSLRGRQERRRNCSHEKSLKYNCTRGPNQDLTGIRFFLHRIKKFKKISMFL